MILLSVVKSISGSPSEDSAEAAEVSPADSSGGSAGEAAELLEVFQWSGADLECRDKLERIREELADVMSCCVLMADVCGLDLDEILNAKVDKNAAKYPVEKARGSAAKYTELI